MITDTRDYVESRIRVQTTPFRPSRVGAILAFLFGLAALALAACSKPDAKPGPHRPPPTMAARLSAAMGDTSDPAADSCNAVMSQHLGGVACASGAGVIYAVYADESGNPLPPGSARCFCVDAGTGLFAMSPLPDEDAGDDAGEGGS